MYALFFRGGIPRPIDQFVRHADLTRRTAADHVVEPFLFLYLRFTRVQFVLLLKNAVAVL